MVSHNTLNVDLKCSIISSYQQNGILLLSWSNLQLLKSFTGAFSQSQSTHPPGTIANSNAPPTNALPPFPSNGLNPSDAHAGASIPNPNGASNPMSTTNSSTLQSNPSPQHPQTPAQQVLISAADRWGLLALIALMRNANSEPDHGLSSMGTDLGTMGLDMSYPGWVGCFCGMWIQILDLGDSEICIRRLSHRGLTRQRHDRWNLTFIYQRVT